jgi:hypothetical protein
MINIKMIVDFWSKKTEIEKRNLCNKYFPNESYFITSSSSKYILTIMNLEKKIK